MEGRTWLTFFPRNDDHSSLGNAHNDVREGSVMGPLLVLMYINYLPYLLSNNVHISLIHSYSAKITLSFTCSRACGWYLLIDPHKCAHVVMGGSDPLQCCLKCHVLGTTIILHSQTTKHEQFFSQEEHLTFKASFILLWTSPEVGFEIGKGTKILALLGVSKLSPFFSHELPQSFIWNFNYREAGVYKKEK